MTTKVGCLLIYRQPRKNYKMHTALFNKEESNEMYPLSFKMSVGCRFLLIWMIMLQAHFPFSTACLEDERSYLLDFKAGLNLSLSPARSLSSWRGFNCCAWEGVACDYHTSHVIRLDLSTRPWDGSDYWYSHRLTGELRPLLFNLQHLQHLDLGWNDIGRGEVPLSLGNMSSLRYLEISGNRHLTSNMFNVWVRNLRSLEFLGMDDVYMEKASEDWGDALSGLANLTQIQLFGCGLSGNIPDLSNLTRLSDIDISWNSFPFELPSWFENVSSLVSLDLSECYLNGSIPSNFMPRSKLSDLALSENPDLIGNLSFILNHSSLATLDLSSTHLTGHIPRSLFQLPALSDLYLGHSQLSGTIPDSISKLATLRALSLPSSGLRGNISLQLLENLTHLQELDLSENQFLINISTSWVPQFALLFLGLRSCNIEGDFPAFLSQQFNLLELDLSDNNMVGNLPSWLWDLPDLGLLNLSNNQLYGSLPRQVPQFRVVDLHGNRLYGSLPALDFVSRMLDLSENEFDGSIPATIGTLQFLSLSGNNLTGEIPSSICTDSNRLMILNLSKNKLTGMIPANIGRCSGLLVLKLAQNVLQREIPEELGNLKTLRTLNLNGNRLKGSIPSSIANCTDLQVLDLGINKFEGSIPVWIEKLTDLRILSLAFNKFKGRIPPQLMKLPNMQILDLSDNHLSGNIPQNLRNLYAMVNQSQSVEVQHIYKLQGYHFVHSPHVLKFDDEVTVWIKGRATPYTKIIKAHKFMDLSRNNLSGNIPQELGILKGLISLNISKNNLSGSIPESLGAMAHLESLDLSENNLSGKIPPQLSNLTFLPVLNLSNNMLSGLIPQGKQFSTFEASSFLGNLNLHGFPLDNKTLTSGLGSRDNHKELNNTAAEDGDADADVMDRWWAVGVGLSYGVGFAMVIAVLCFHIKWRYICFAVMDNLIYSLFDR